MKRRTKKRLLVLLAGAGYVLLRYRSGVVRWVGDATDWLAWGWPAGVALSILAAVVWLADRLPGPSPETVHPLEVDTEPEPEVLSGSIRTAHVQLGIRGMILGTLAVLGIWMETGWEYVIEAVVVWGLVALVAFAAYEIRLWRRGGVQFLEVDDHGLTVRNRRLRKSLTWDEVVAVEDPVVKEGLKLVPAGSGPEVWLYRTGHSWRDFDRLVRFVETRCCS